MTSYTHLQYVASLLEQEWSASISGRSTDVPQPDVIIAGQEDGPTRVESAVNDLIFVREGGAMSISPRSVGWTEERVEARVTLDIRTTEGRDRFVGTRNSDGSVDRYPGLHGETKRCLDMARKGEYEFDWVASPEWRDLSEDIGYAHWRGQWEVQLTEIAHTITPEP